VFSKNTIDEDSNRQQGSYQPPALKLTEESKDFLLYNFYICLIEQAFHNPLLLYTKHPELAESLLKEELRTHIS